LFAEICGGIWSMELGRRLAQFVLNLGPIGWSLRLQVSGLALQPHAPQ
jgi:hypothetical protein